MSDIVDQTVTFRAIEERIAQTTNPRHLMMLKRLLQHAVGEATADLDMVMDTLNATPAYHSFGGGPAMSPVGREAVEKFYIEDVFGRGKHFFQFDIDRMIVDDASISTEGAFHMMLWGHDGVERGMKLDDADACYILHSRLLIVWPFDEEGFITGEDSYSAITRADFLEKLSADKVPEGFTQYVESRLAAA